MAAETSRSVKVIDQSKVAPPPGSVSTTAVALTFIDVRCLFLDVKALKSVVPKLPLHCLSSSSNTTHVVPIMAIQFTVFPNSGISVGVTLNHAAADGKNPHGLSSIYLDDLRKFGNLNPIGDHQVPPDNVLTTLVLKQTKIKQLKHWIATADNQQQSKINDEEIRISTFAVACAFMWVNLMKLQEQIRGSLDDDDDMLYHFLALADCRERFGRELMGANGMVIVAKAIGRQIYELGKGSVFKGEEKFSSSSEEIFKDGRVVTVASSPNFWVYETDFGWGKPKKVEMVHIKDGT
ncbi:hypothetical protein JRO89_XS02G0230700 [Xanthoceras sorbifolium]|uniref:Uncharacterized protein n=1 Tax=Xanthoceras sorbifolium TaxID=99658 RepID=A0ABQ8IGP8_9ROSI|nr:hypothetical protein JRO89_XS02G0230700 [Xanthoceras sorbifolium]